ncbi:hypothetical protein ABMA28_016505 [Loxostege sticticalis]|uniref:FP protein C-terminal domain-containing protein n=1 Tax=Loxostege sticticalis TaxID=481309 RepID=A0ABD0T951_LOXSC
MLRSPNKLYNSDPELRTAVEQENVTHRKRKHGEDFSEAFDDFTSKITDTLNNWKTEIHNEISQLKNNFESVLKADLVKLNGSVADIKSEINNVRQEYQDMKKTVLSLDTKYKGTLKKIQDLEKSIEFSSDQMDDYNKKIDVLTQANNKIESLEAQITELTQDNKQLKLEMNMNNQRDRLLNLEIVGVTEGKDENLTAIVMSIAKHANVLLSSEDIVEVNRISPKSRQPGRPRNIVVKLKSRLLKDNIISGARKNRLTTKDLDLTSDVRPIYVNEHLTQQNKFLLKKCRETAKQKQYQYVWTKNGRIYVRRNDISPALQVTQDSDILKII